MSLIWESGTNSRGFETGLTVDEVNFFFTKMQNIHLVATHKKFYRKQPVEFLVIEHIVLKNQSSPEFLNIKFLKGGTLLYLLQKVAHESQQSIENQSFFNSSIFTIKTDL